MKKFTYMVIGTLLLVLLATPVVIFASSIENARYWAQILVSNNSTATANVATTANISSTNLINGGYLNSSANNSVMRTSSGADVAFMPSVNSTYPWSLWVPDIGANSYRTYVLYTANSTGGKMRYFPDAGGMTIADDVTMEPSDNFSIELDAFLNASGNLFTKKDAIYSTYDSVAEKVRATTGTLIFEDTFDTDLWNDVGTLISVNVTASRLDYDAIRGDDIDSRTSYDLTTVSDTEWQLDYTWNPVSAPTEASNTFVFGLWDSLANYATFAGDAIFALQQDPSTIKLNRQDGGAGASSATITIVHGTTYYVTLERNTAILATLGIYSDTARSAHIAGSPVTLAIPATVVDLRYLNASNNKVVAANGEEIGWIDDLLFGEGIVGITATGVSSGEHNVKVAEPLALEFDGADSIATVTDAASIQNIFDGGGTVSAWVNPASDGEGNEAKIYSKSHSFAVFSEAAGKVKLRVVQPTSGNTGAWTTTNTEVPLNTWSLVSYTFNASTLVTPIIYVDGISVAVTVDTAATGTRTTDVGTDFTIGNHPTVTRTFDGSMTEMRMFSRILSPTEIAEHSQEVYSDNTDLEGYWKMSEGGGTVIIDSTANNNTGALATISWVVGRLKLYIDNILEDFTIGVAVLGNANDWVIGSANATPYINTYQHSVNGTMQSSIAWEFDTVFTDLTGKGNDAVPTFRGASSNPDVSANMTSFQAISESQAPAYVLSLAPAFLTPNTENVTSGWAVTPPSGGFPLSDVISSIANATGTPPQLPLLIIAVFIILAGSLSMSYVARKHGSGTLIVKTIVIVALMGIFIGMKNFGIEFWMLVVFLVLAVGIMMSSKQASWG